jgi:hypothetical protein
MSHLDSLELSAIGLSELTSAEASSITGGGWLSNLITGVTAPMALAVSLVNSILYDMLNNPKETWDSAVDGFKATAVVP